MTEAPSRGRARRRLPDGTTASSRGWPLPLEEAGRDPLVAGSHGSEPCRGTFGPPSGGADPTRGASDPRGGNARLGRILGPLHAAGEAVCPVSRGGAAAPRGGRTRGGGQPAPPPPAPPPLSPPDAAPPGGARGPRGRRG